MAHLAKLKFSDKQRSQVKMTVEERLRHKLIDRLKEQKERKRPGNPTYRDWEDVDSVHH